MSGRTNTHHGLASLAARQYGIVTRAQLADLGLTERAVELYLRNGGLQAWHRDVFAVGHGGLSAHGLCMAAVLFRGDGAVLSFQSAVWLWGLERKLEIPVGVSVPGGSGRGRRSEEFGLHRCPDLREEDLTTTELMPVTAVPRTLLDYASIARQYKLELAVERADRMGLLLPVAFERVLDELPEHPGREPLWRSLTLCRDRDLYGTRAA
ncbi:MAG: hypothetical protein JST53_06385 [Actinobacteria bacterium]|nr:hypothetical protein [Actinomycetota bacterium]